MVDQVEQEPKRALSPLDYQQLLVAHDPNDAYAQPHADFWRKCKMENGKPAKRRDGKPAWVTPPIISHRAVQKLARLFGVRVKGWRWTDRNLEPKPTVTCEMTVAGYQPLSDDLASRIVGKPVTLLVEYDVPDETTEIGEINDSNAESVGRKYPQCLSYKRAFDRGVLNHLGLFECYGDSEEPRFAQNAKYEEPPPEEERQEGVSPEAQERNTKWMGLPADMRKEAKELIRSGKLENTELKQACEDCNWETEQIRAALEGWKARADG